jgi:hypothetical protein
MAQLIFFSENPLVFSNCKYLRTLNLNRNFLKQYHNLKREADDHRNIAFFQSMAKMVRKNCQEFITTYLH